MFSLRGSIAARLVLSYGVLGIASMVVVSGVFYFGTIGVLDENINTKMRAQSLRLAERVRSGSAEQVADDVRRQLGDGIDSDREIYLVTNRDGAVLAGNLAGWPRADAAADGVLARDVIRNGRTTHARLLVHQLPQGGALVIGYDLSERESIRQLVWRSLAEGAALSLILTVLGAVLFRRQIERRIGDIRRAASDIGAGDLSRRIAVHSRDEFGLLNRDINTMLDRIEQLMDGIRNVSNAIAHDLRTPLTRIRAKLDDAVRHELSVDVLASAAHGAIDDIDDLIRLFERLLQIAQAESGVGARAFETIDLQRIAADMAEMYDASAEDRQVRLAALAGAALPVQADRNLIATAVASLIDNAIKHAGAGAEVEVSTALHAGMAEITVRDNGPGIPAGERAKVTQRFYRLDKSRGIPGNGLGLSIVKAIATLHGGDLELDDAAPGLVARLRFPAGARGRAGSGPTELTPS